MEIEINGINVSYDDEGEGKCVLLLHGWGANKESLSPIFNTVKKSFRAVAPDMPGCGKTGEPEKPWCAADYAEFIRAFIEKTKIRPFAAIGHSNGGRVLIKMSEGAFCPEKLILVDSAGLKPHRGASYYIKVYTYKLGKKILSLPGSFLYFFVSTYLTIVLFAVPLIIFSESLLPVISVPDTSLLPVAKYSAILSPNKLLSSLSGSASISYVITSEKSYNSNLSSSYFSLSLKYQSVEISFPTVRASVSKLSVSATLPSWRSSILLCRPPSVLICLPDSISPVSSRRKTFSACPELCILLCLLPSLPSVRPSSNAGDSLFSDIFSPVSSFEITPSLLFVVFIIPLSGTVFNCFPVGAEALFLTAIFTPLPSARAAETILSAVMPCHRVYCM